MQTQPAVKRRTPSKPRPRALPYPDLPSSIGNRRNFWLSAWQRDVAEHEALRRLTERKTFGKESQPLRYAVYGALKQLEEDVATSLRNVTDEGGLLLAWMPEGGAA